MRRLPDDPRHAVLHPSQALLAGDEPVIRADHPALAAHRREVAVISGAGAGPAPAHAGYVGAGMLHAAMAGEAFTSPGADAVLTAIRAVAGPEGALLVVENDTGDRLNFGLAAGLARADGIPVEIVVVADDVALRDIAGAVLVHKVAGAAAAACLSLEEVAAEADAAADAVGTMGAAPGPCIVRGQPGFTSPPDEAARGVRRARFAPADALVDGLLATIIDDRALRPGEQVALLVNGLGGTPATEIAIVARAALERLRAAGLVVARAWSGNLPTAFGMPAYSLSVMRLDERRLARLSAATEAPAWPGDGVVGERLRLLGTAIAAARGD